MIVLDTNVISEPIKVSPEPVVVSWLSMQPAETLYFTSVSLAELLLGVEIMPSHCRRNALKIALLGRVGRLFGPLVLSFDPFAAPAFAERVPRARTSGRAISVADGHPRHAAMRGFMVATRGEAPFTAAGVPTINPWTIRH